MGPYAFRSRRMLRGRVNTDLFANLNLHDLEVWAITSNTLIRPQKMSFAIDFAPNLRTITAGIRKRRPINPTLTQTNDCFQGPLKRASLVCHLAERLEALMSRGPIRS